MPQKQALVSAIRGDKDFLPGVGRREGFCSYERGNNSCLSNNVETAVIKVQSLGLQ